MNYEFYSQIGRFCLSTQETVSAINGYLFGKSKSLQQTFNVFTQKNQNRLSADIVCIFSCIVYYKKFGVLEKSCGILCQNVQYEKELFVIEVC